MDLILVPVSFAWTLCRVDFCVTQRRSKKNAERIVEQRKESLLSEKNQPASA